MRFPPVTEAEMTPEQRTVAAEIAAGPRGELRGPFVPMIRSPALAAHVQRLGAFLRFETGIPDDCLEIAILMTARHYDCAFVWESHRVLGTKAGVPREVIAAIAARRAPPGLAPPQAAVATFCAELLARNKVPDAAFDGIDKLWGRKGVMDLTAVCGYYGLMARVLNVAERPMPPGAAPFSA